MAIEWPLSVTPAANQEKCCEMLIVNITSYTMTQKLAFNWSEISYCRYIEPNINYGLIYISRQGAPLYG
jgi:hypothetical protein